MESADKSPFFADESVAYERRRLFDPYNETFTFGIATARRLSELTRDETFLAPSYDTEEMTGALDDFSSVGVTFGSTISDVLFGVVGDIFASSFSFIVDGIFLGLKGALFVLRMLVKSGMLTTVINIGTDMVIIFFTEIMIPQLMMFMAFLTCILDLFRPAGWTDQLKCVEEKCFKGVDAVADLLVFWSMPLFLHRFVAIMEATLNSRTGRRFFGGGGGESSYTSQGRTRNPDTGEVLDNPEPESASFENPVYQFDFADNFADWLPTTGADKCGGCFTCQVPELRILWLIVAGIGSLISSGNTFTFIGNVSQNCLTNGSWYLQACGPWPSTGDDTMLPWSEWSRYPFKYDAGFQDYDATIFDKFTARLIERSEEIGADADPEFALLVRASHTWMQMRDTAAYDELLDDAIVAGDVPPSSEFANYEQPKAAAFTYHACRVARHAAKKRNQSYDSHGDFHLRASGSIEAITNEYLFRTCKRFKFETYTNAGRDIQDATGELYACAYNRVECKKSEVECLGTCSGVDGTEYHHDFATVVSLSELSEFVLGNDFNDSAPANCSVKNVVLELDTFAGGDSFKTFAARARTRSGMTAIGARARTLNALTILF